jgi:hypothetical protein
MPVLSDEQTYYLARQVGLSRSAAITATAIAHPESRLNTEAHNDDPSTGDNSYGLWQINMYNGLGPVRKVQFHLHSYDDLFDPQVNALAMRDLSANGTSWLPWTTYKSGAYKPFVAQASAAADRVDHMTPAQQNALGTGFLGGTTIQKSPLGGYKVGPLSPAEKTAQNIQKGWEAVLSFVTTAHNWWRVAGVIAGAILVFIAIMTILSPVLEPATRVAVKAASRGLV